MTTVMLVDDSATMRMSLTAVLTHAGFGVETARNGAEGIDRLTAGSTPAVIISDVNMPGMDGIEFVGAVRRTPGFAEVPVLVLSTESHAVLRRRARAAGATGWIVKPVEGADLLRMIRQVLPGG